MTIAQAVTKYAIKAAGVAGAGILLYDAHKEGKRIADITARKANSDAALDWFDNTRNLHQPSAVNMKLKDKLFDLELTNNLRGFVNSGIGYVKGFVGMMFSDTVPWALSAAALLTKGPSAAHKGTAAKASGIGLGLYALYAFAKNVCGLGVSQR
ncbi:MAG: hypothetical protein NC200_04995 [Candidatus Gastranaerophilales bacterium]|nr:hypothetical protein [Candidatus Gastranaerophilales bacterium]